MARRSYAGGAAPTTLSSPITTSSATATVVDATNYPDTNNGPFSLVIDRGTSTEEKVLVASRSGASLTFAARGYDGTVAQNHSGGASVEHISTAIDHDEANEHINTAAGVHGLPSGDSPVGLTATQTVRNKTFAACDGDFDTLTWHGQQVVDLSSVQTLANKALNSPTLNGVTQAQTINADVLSQAGKQVATKDGSETLTNKTLTSPTINGGTQNNPAISGASLYAGTSHGQVLDSPSIAGVATGGTLNPDDIRTPATFKDSGGTTRGSVSDDGIAQFKADYAYAWLDSAYFGVWFPGIWTQIPIDTFWQNPNGWSLSNDGIVVPRTGVYELSGALTFYGSNSSGGFRTTTQWGFNESKNGPYNHNYSGSAGADVTNTLPVHTRPMNAGDRVGIWGWHNSSVGSGPVRSATGTWICVRYIGS